MTGSSFAGSPQGIASLGAVFCVIVPVVTIYLCERRLRHVSEEAVANSDAIVLGVGKPRPRHQQPPSACCIPVSLAHGD
jgi:hypothetical protein